jgi:hypothetical protein
MPTRRPRRKTADAKPAKVNGAKVLSTFPPNAAQTQRILALAARLNARQLAFYINFLLEASRKQWDAFDYGAFSIFQAEQRKRANR